jgi:hypothetical protein
MQFLIGNRAQNIQPGDELNVLVDDGNTSAGAQDAEAAEVQTSGSYNSGAASNYALNHALSYNANYANYNSCGGDCANFVSQCFYRGGQATDSYWYRVNGTGPCAGETNVWCGSGTQWYNNWGLRNWAINQGRGTNVSGIDVLGRGDIVNYDWDQNGSYQHVTIVTDPTNNLVSSHNADRKNVAWKMGDSSAGHKFTFMWTYY